MCILPLKEVLKCYVYKILERFKINPQSAGLHCFPSRSRNSKEKSPILSGNGKIAVVGYGLRQSPGLADRLRQHLQPPRAARRFRLPDGRGGKQNLPRFGCPAGDGKRNIFPGNTCNGFRRACFHLPPPTPPAPRRAALPCAVSPPPPNKICRRGHGGSPGQAGIAAAAASPPAGGRQRRGGNRPRLPEERGSLRPVQVFEEASAGTSRRGGVALRRGSAPQRSPGGFPPALAAGAEAAPREAGAASPALGQ